jgi:hypothetical protein
VKSKIQNSDFDENEDDCSLVIALGLYFLESGSMAGNISKTLTVLLESGVTSPVHFKNLTSKGQKLLLDKGMPPMNYSWISKNLVKKEISRKRTFPIAFDTSQLIETDRIKCSASDLSQQPLLKTPGAGYTDTNFYDPTPKGIIQRLKPPHVVGLPIESVELLESVGMWSVEQISYPLVNQYSYNRSLTRWQ